jgi:probable HAF family extracellular repeat protein
MSLIRASWTKLLIAIVSVIAPATAIPTISRAQSIQGLGFLPGGILSEALGVNADGSVVVGYSQAPGQAEAFRWTAASGMVGLGFLPGGNGSIAQGVSADGNTAVGGSSDAVTGLPQAFRWTAAQGMVGIGFLPGSSNSYLPGSSNSYAYGISADGGERNVALRRQPACSQAGGCRCRRRFSGLPTAGAAFWIAAGCATGTASA